MAKGKSTKVTFGKEPDGLVLTMEERVIPKGKPPKRIRMLISVGNTKMYQRGEVFSVPHDVPVNTARSWIAAGVAEEDKSLSGPPEVK